MRPWSARHRRRNQFCVRTRRCPTLFLSAPEKFSCRMIFPPVVSIKRCQIRVGNRIGRKGWIEVVSVDPRMLASDGRIDRSGPRGCRNAPHFQGRPVPRQPFRRDASVKVRLLVMPPPPGSNGRGALVLHKACRITANFRATAILAFLNPDAFANFRPLALSVENRRLRVRSVVAAS